MLATVEKIGGLSGSCEARTENELLFVFAVPEGADLGLSHVLEIDPLALNTPQEVHNRTTNQRLTVVIKDNDIHDLRLPAKHGGSRRPSPQRIQSP